MSEKELHLDRYIVKSFDPRQNRLPHVVMRRGDLSQVAAFDHVEPALDYADFLNGRRRWIARNP